MHYTRITALLLALLYWGCNKKFDAPPEFETPDIKGSVSIAALKAMHTAGKLEKINDDITIEATVIGDDKSGNLYKQVVLQDASGGIVLKLDGYDLYTSYPAGRKLFVKCKGLYLGDYNRLVQLGGGVDNSTPSQPQLMPVAAGLFDQYIVKGSLNNIVTPRVVAISALSADMYDSLQSTLVQLNNMEFSAADTGKTYADTSQTLSSVNLTLKSCSGSSITLRNSSYASFAGIAVPRGNGNITAIYTVYGTTKQLNIRDTGDVQLNGVRCSTANEQKHIADIRALYKDAPVVLPANCAIKGIVISDRTAKNIPDNNLVLQEGNGLPGLLLRFTEAYQFNKGDVLEVNVSSLTLDMYQGSLQLNNIPTGNALKTGTDSITPRVVTAAQLNDDKNFAAWESTLVSLQQVTISGGTNAHWSGNTTLTDASGTVTAVTRPQALFADSAYPPGVVNKFTGIVQYSNSAKTIACRTANDVQSAAAPPPPPVTGNDSGIVLQTAPLNIGFNELGNGLPVGVTVRTGASAAALGSTVAFSVNKAQWGSSTGAYKNFASAAALTAASDQHAQDSAADRALGIRQVGNTSTGFPGSDPGAAFVFEISNTAGKTGIQLDFLLQSLDDGSARTTTWTVDYGIGDNPQSFIPVSATGNMVTGGSSFSNNAIHADFGAALDNINSKVWVRIVTLAAAGGTGSRASTAIDAVQFNWK
ncbi:DUF5689 domain-containing protein [Deminuibacter soli]|uniref:DUF5689 domain-containing protein n=1 Tax=Deminuibacter soli TaxID=2291815 RepID=A0A3E1NLW3_9BACT|nr:DUF5689 domain-containing protein [Deminuibacter soli]RFM28788.1 hypothetical protein DXN05_08400 [Deminuibacter soli]